MVDEANLGTCVRPLPEQSTILAVVEHLQGSGHQNPVRLSTLVSDSPSRLLPSCAVAVNQLRASSTNSAHIIQLHHTARSEHMAHDYIPLCCKL